MKFSSVRGAVSANEDSSGANKIKYAEILDAKRVDTSLSNQDYGDNLPTSYVVKVKGLRTVDEIFSLSLPSYPISDRN